MSVNKFIISTNAKRSQIESTETHYKLKGIPITINDSVMNGVLYSKEENAKGIPSIKGKPFTIDHPADENGNFISALEGNGLMDFFSGGVVTNAYEVDETWYVDAEIKKSLLAAQTNGKELTEKLEGKGDLGVSTGLYFENNQVTGTNAAGQEYHRVAKNQDFNHLAAVDNPAGGKGTTAVFNSDNTFACNFTDIKLDKKSEDKRSLHIKAWNAAKKAIGFNALSHDDIRRDLNSKINQGFSEGSSKWVMEVYDNYFIYIDEADGGDYFQLSYSIDNDGVTVSGEPEKVERKFVKAGNFANDNQTGYNNTDLNTNHEAPIMDRTEMLEALGLATNSQVTDDELKTLLKTKLAANASEVLDESKVTSIVEQAVNAAVKPLQEQLTANADKELNEVAEQVAALNKGLDAEDAKALGLTKAKAFLTANSAEYVAGGYTAPRGRASQVNANKEDAAKWLEIDLNAGLAGDK